MSDFTADHVINFDLLAKSDEIFFEDISKGEPAKIRGTFFIGGYQEQQPKIDFFILSPSKRVIYAKRKTMDGIFSFNTTDPGQYSFVFSNMKQKKDKKVTFAFQVVKLNQEKSND